MSEIRVDDFFANAEVLGMLEVPTSPDMHNNVASSWPLLEKLGQGNEDVQQMIFAVWQAYEAYRTDAVLQPLDLSLDFLGKKIPVFKKPPGYKSDFLQELANKIQYAQIGMDKAIAIVDIASQNKVLRAVGDRVTFGGKFDRTLYDVAFDGKKGPVYVARRGADIVPHDSPFKMWQYELVQSKEQEADGWYILLFFPFRKAKIYLSRD